MDMRRLLLITTVVLAACSKDSTTAPTTTPITTGTSSSGQNIAFDAGTTDGQTLPVASTVPLRVHVTQAGVGVPNVTVTWTMTFGHGSVSSATSTTDAAGAAAVTWTLGDTVGTNTIAAVITGASVTLNASAVAGPVSSLAKITPDSSGVVAGASMPLVARAVDRFGNAVSGAVVTWTTSPGALSATTVTTGTSGNAETVLTTAAKGTYTATATLAGKAAVIFKVAAF